jgi:hypothetical protein
MTRKPASLRAKSMKWLPRMRKAKPSISARPTQHPPLQDFVDTAALALGLPLEPQWRPAVLANLEVILGQAALVTELSLPDEAEPAPVFRA